MRKTYNGFTSIREESFDDGLFVLLIESIVSGKGGRLHAV